MSDIAEKLARPEAAPLHVRARCKLKHFACRFGVQGELDPKSPPKWLEIHHMGTREVWVRVDSGKASDAIYELVKKEPITGKGE